MLYHCHMRFHLTRKLAVKLKLGTLDVAPPAAGDGLDCWYANLFTVDRRQVILFVNEPSLLALLCYGSGVTGSAKLLEAFQAAMIGYFQPRRMLAPYMQATGIEAFQSIRTYRTANRRVLGVMNEFMACCKYFIDEHDGQYLDFMMDELNSMPVGKLEYSFPGRQFVRCVKLSLMDQGLLPRETMAERLAEVESHRRIMQRRELEAIERQRRREGLPPLERGEADGGDSMGGEDDNDGDAGIIEFRKPG